MKVKNKKRSALIVGCYIAAFAILSVVTLINFPEAPVEKVGRIVFLALWAFLLIEQVIRVARMERQERVLYAKMEKAEIVFFLLSLGLFPLALISGKALASWIILLKLPAVLHNTNDEKSFQFIVNIIVVILIGIFLLPFMQVVAVALSKPGSIVNLWPKNVDTWGVDYVVHDKSFLRAIGISIFITLVGTALSVTMMTMAAYPLSKKKMPFRRTMMVFFLIVMLFNGGMAPNILLMNSLGLTNTIWALIFPNAVMVFHLLLLKGFFEEIPPELEESAKLDGANNYTILFKIIVPVAAPMIATVAFFTAIAYWNNINNSILYITSNQSIYPLPMYIKNFLSTNPVDIANANPTLLTYWDNVKMSYILISIVPVLVVYPFILRYIKSGVAVGAVKG